MQASRLLSFDAMRGLAAIAVLLYHAEPSYAPSGYLAVDVFFLLSGFVIARSYDERFAAGMSLGRFAALRLIRFYPLYLVGLGLGIFRCVGQILLDRPDRLAGWDVGVSAFFGLLFLPSPVTPHIAPLNHPAWSLLFELAVNIVYAAGLWKARLRVLVLVTALCGLVFLGLALRYGSIGMGFSWATLAGGAMRVSFAFGVGAIMAKLFLRPASSSAWALLPLAVLPCLLLFPIDPAHRLVYELFTACLAGPILLGVSAAFNPPAVFSRISEALGDLSYAIYAVHFPLLWMFGYVARKAGLGTPVWVPIYVVMILVLAGLCDRYYDKPVRRWLTASMKRGVSAPRMPATAS